MQSYSRTGLVFVHQLSTPPFFDVWKGCNPTCTAYKKPSEKFSSEPQVQVQGLEGCDTAQTNKEGLQNCMDEKKGLAKL